MKVRYTGPSGSGVDVVHADPTTPDTNTVTHCPPGETVDLPDDVAQAQVETGLFDTVGRKLPASPAEPVIQED